MNNSPPSSDLRSLKVMRDPEHAEMVHLRSGLRSSSRVPFPVKPKIRTPVPSEMTEKTIAAIMNGVPVVFGKRLLIAQSHETAGDLEGAGVVLFAEIETSLPSFQRKRICWMTMAALMLAIDAGRAHLALNGQKSGGAE